MAAVRLPDGSELEIRPGDRARDVAERIGPRLLRDAVVAKLDGRLVDLDSLLNGGGEFEIVTKDSPEGLEVLRHSTAHAMAQAILELYPESKLTLGPPIEDGFFYDIEVAGRITDEDLPRIEERMREIVERDLPIEREEVSKKEAERLYEDNPYKLEIIRDLEDGDISVYRQGEFFDLCRGPHVRSTGALGAFKLQNIAGAYWRGDENNPMLTRVYGTAWPTEKQLKAYLRRLEEAKETGPPQDRQGAQALYLLAGRGRGHPAVSAQGRDAPAPHGGLRARGTDAPRLRARVDGAPGQREALREERATSSTTRTRCSRRWWTARRASASSR